jgi:hypothetical protein
VYEPYCGEVAAPNPDYPQEIRIVNGTQNINIVKKNLFDKNNQNFKQYYILDDNGEEIASNIAQYSQGFTKVKPNTTYTLNGTIANNNTGFRIYFYDKNQNFISRSSLLGTLNIPYIFTTTNNIYYLRFQMGVEVYNGDTVQLEEGSTATTYEPYQGQTYPIDLKSKNLLPFPYTQSTITHNGVTFTVNNDGSILVNGTASADENASIKLYGNYQEINQMPFTGKYLSGGTNIVRLRAFNNTGNIYTVLGNDTGSGAEIDTTTYTKGYIELAVLKGTTADNVLIKPMVLDNLDDTTYETYYNYELCKVREYKDEIKKATGKNLQENNWIDGKYDGTGIGKNVHLLINNGNEFNVGDTITIQFDNIVGYNSSIYLQNSTSEKFFGNLTYSNGTSYLTKTLTQEQVNILNGENVRLASYRKDGISTNNIFNSMISKNDSVQDYEPFGKVWYLYKKIGKVVLDGSES